MLFLAGLAGAIAATMIDPIVAIAGVAAFLIGRTRDAVATGLSVCGFSLAIFLFVKIAAQAVQRDVGGERFFSILIAVAAWTLIAYVVSRLISRPGSVAK